MVKKTVVIKLDKNFVDHVDTEMRRRKKKKEFSDADLADFIMEAVDYYLQSKSIEEKIANIRRFKGIVSSTAKIDKESWYLQ